MRALALLGVFAAVAAAAAAAPAKEPRKAIKPAVQARAKRIAVQLRDLPGFGWKATPAQSDRSKPRCSYYDPDQSKLTGPNSHPFDDASPDTLDIAGLVAGASNVQQPDATHLTGTVDLTKATSSEHNLRNLYRRWNEFMAADDWDALATWRRPTQAAAAE